MKKKYFTPEMDEVKLDSPVVLQFDEPSGEEIIICNETCSEDTCLFKGLN